MDNLTNNYLKFTRIAYCSLVGLLIIVSSFLEAFEPRQITSMPTIGYQDIPFFDDINNLNRKLLVWYPVELDAVSEVSNNPWDLFDVANNAAIAQSSTKRPVVILSHGWKGNPHQLSWLIRGLVQDGFIVIGIQHQDFINGKLHINHWLRAQDLIIALDQFMSTSFVDSANVDQIGVAGFSLGGTTAILASGGRFSDQKSLFPPLEYVYQHDFSNLEQALPDLNKSMMTKNWRDPRISAAFVIAPTWSWLFDEESLREISLPMYLVATSGDQVIVTEHNAGFFAKIIPDVVYQEIPGNGGHYIFLSAVGKIAQQQIDPTGNLVFLFEDAGRVDRSSIQWQLGQEAARFFKEAF